MTTRSLTRALCLALTLPACALDQPSDDPAAVADDTLPDGTTGVDRIHQGPQTLLVPWVARDGLKWVDDDYSIGPALVKEAYAQAEVTVGKWPFGHVPYCIHHDGALAIGSLDEAQIDASLNTLEQISPLHFDKFTCGAASQPQTFLDYRRKLDDKETSVTTAGIGHAGNTIQFNKNNPDGGLNDHTVTHETGHALGYMHEQKRPDRQNYVIYTPACLDDPTSDSQFAQVAASDVPLVLTPYDELSVMQYGSFSFSSDKHTCPTLTWAAPDPATAPWGGVYHTPSGTHIRGTEIPGKEPWSDEDINATYQLYEPVLGSPETNDRFGQTMVAGDFDGDGYDDLAVGAIGEQVGSGHGGAVLLYKGTRNGLVAWGVLQESDFSGVTTHSGDQFGGALAAGDLDGDGITDLVVGAPFYGTPTGGAVFTYLGRKRGGPKAVGGATTQSSSGAGADEASDMFGAAIAIGHFAGGTTGYVAVGSPFEHISGVTGSRGMVSVMRWTGSGYTNRENLHPSDVGISVAGGQFGSALATADFDNDAKDDLLVGAPGDSSSTGQVGTFFGGATAMVAGSALVPSDTLANNDRFGTSVAAAPLPGGGWAAIAGAPGHAGPGRAYKFLGLGTRTLTQVGSFAQSQIPGETGHAGDNFGAHVAVADMTGTGNATFLVGASGKPIAGVSGAGEIAVFGVTNKVLAPTSPTASDSFGTAFAVGNFDHGAHSPGANTQQDLAVGLPGRTESGFDNAGKADIYQGSSLTLWRQINESTSVQQ